MFGNKVLKYVITDHQRMDSIMNNVSSKVDNILYISQIGFIETCYLVLDRYIRNISLGATCSELQESISYFQAALSRIMFK